MTAKHLSDYQAQDVQALIGRRIRWVAGGDWDEIVGVEESDSESGYVCHLASGETADGEVAGLYEVEARASDKAVTS